ncbi:MAG: heat-inducible transcription repressor HrcA [candidate division NC10 bacterium]|nr:heat-inducible transcription repressor HrcA [candidate division NC10 bacterium]
MIEDIDLLSGRQRSVLRAIIQDYIRTAEPVGSRTVVKRYGFSLSPASIRTIMSDLEELGYVAQPHTSAGRIPTDKGYRAFVDALMERAPLSQEEVERIEQGMAPSTADPGDLLKETGRLLAALSAYVAVALSPRFQTMHFRRVELVSLSRERVMVILLADSGLVHHRAVAVREPMSQEDLDRGARYLTELMRGKTLTEVRDLLIAQMAEEKEQYDRMLAEALRLGAQALEGEAEAEVVVTGAAHIADQPEFANITKMKALFSAFEEKSKLVQILNECLRGEGCRVFIGRELSLSDMQDLSLIASPYRRKDQVLGVVGIMGPTRMDYGRALALVETTASLLTRTLTDQAV